MNSLYERTEEALAKAGMQFSDVVRTWMFLDRLLEWYDDFNCLRTVFLEMHDIFNRVLPASTGVGVCNPFGSAVVADMLAIKRKTDKISIREVASPRQCPATDYQSSFSRAVVIDSPRERAMLVSGTASIGAEGETLHVGDVRAQVEETLDVMEQLLGSQQFGWNDVTRGIAYFKHPADARIFDEVCARRGISTAPYALAQADICRHTLLFELELDATRLK
jgi:enamine deaminase RidA (YjgF/YER057c/UK114 family)